MRSYTPSFVCLARIIVYNSPNKAFKADSQRLAVLVQVSLSV